MTQPLQYHFQGSLLGLWLAPVAVNLLQKPAERPLGQSMDKLSISAFNLIKVMSLQAVGSLELQPLPEQSRALPCWLTILPLLLRYHDTWSRQRHQLFLQVDVAQSWLPRGFSEMALAKALLFGDLFALTLNQAHFSAATALTYLNDLAQRGDLSLALRPHYQALLTGSLAWSLKGQTPSGKGGDHFVSILLSVFDASESYRLAMGRALQCSEGSGETVQQSASHLLAAGVLAGVWQGAARMPALWQTSAFHQQMSAERVMPVSRLRPEVMAISNRLFNQWAGNRAGSIVAAGEAVAASIC